MFKRRDWVHMHGQDGEGSSDDESSEDSQQEASSDSESSGSEASEAAESSGLQQEEGLSGVKRLQDLSEDDFDEPESQELEKPRVDVEELVQNWLSTPDAEHLKGPPLRCKWCPGTLLLNAKSLKTHIDSKRHQKRQKLSEDEPHPICLAEETEAGDTEEAETHAERLQRLRKISAPLDLSGLSASQKRKSIRKLRAEQRKKALLHRPGKRQRAQLKAEVFNPAAAEGHTPAKKAKKAQETRGKQNKQHKEQKAGISKKRHKSRAV